MSYFYNVTLISAFSNHRKILTAFHFVNHLAMQEKTIKPLLILISIIVFQSLNHKKWFL